jgi:hypothetical protein
VTEHTELICIHKIRTACRTELKSGDLIIRLCSASTVLHISLRPLGSSSFSTLGGSL